MLPVISQAITYGFSALQILKFLASKFPSLKGSIESAQASGFDPDKILKFLSHKIPHSKEGAQRQLNANDQYLSSIGVKTKEEREASRNRALSGVLGVGAGALGTYAMSRAVPQILQQFGGLGAGASPMNSPQGPTAGMQQAPQAQQPQAMPTATPQNAPPMQAQALQPVTPALPQRNAKASLELLKNIGEEGRVSNLLQGGLSPKDVAGVLRKLLPKDKLQALEASEGGLEGLVEDVAASRQAAPIENLGGVNAAEILPQSEQVEGLSGPKTSEIEQPQELSPPIQEEEAPTSLKVGDVFKTRRGESATITKLNDKTFEYKTDKGGIRSGPLSSLDYEMVKSKNEEEKPKSIKKAETVVTPQGIGIVRELRNGKALVDIDGKMHKIDEADLERPLFTDDEIADAYDRVMEVTPEEHKSGFISWAGYDEDRKVLGYIPRGGKYEELSDITPEEAELIKTGKGVARTGGEKREGFWVVGGDTRGLISQINHDRRRAREASEKQQLKLFDIPKREKEDKGMKPIFDEMAHARGLSQTRDKKKALEERAHKKKEKEEEKERIKREKDEAKKRKK